MRSYLNHNSTYSKRTKRSLPLFALGDMVWLENRRRNGEISKFQPSFIGPCHVFSNHTYETDKNSYRMNVVCNFSELAMWALDRAPQETKHDGVMHRHTHKATNEIEEILPNPTHRNGV